MSCNCPFDNVSLQQSTRGVVSAVGESLCAFASALGPIVGAPLFAWSESTGKSSQLQLLVTYTLHRNSAPMHVLVKLKGDSAFSAYIEKYLQSLLIPSVWNSENSTRQFCILHYNGIYVPVTFNSLNLCHFLAFKLPTLCEN